MYRDEIGARVPPKKGRKHRRMAKKMKQTHSTAITGAYNAVHKELTALRLWRERIVAESKTDKYPPPPNAP